MVLKKGEKKIYNIFMGKEKRVATEKEYEKIRKKLYNEAKKCRDKKQRTKFKHYYRLYLIVWILARTGMTLKDVLAIKVGDIKEIEGEGQYYVEVVVNQNRVIRKHIPEKLYEYITSKYTKFMRIKDKNAYLIPGNKNKEYDYYEPLGTTAVKNGLRDVLEEIEEESNSLKRTNPQEYEKEYEDCGIFSELSPVSIRMLYKQRDDFKEEFPMQEEGE